MQSPTLSRRELLVAGGATMATMALLNARLAQAAPLRQGDVVLPWLDQPEENPAPDEVLSLLVWEDLDSWITPNDQFFGIAHYEYPEINLGQWQLSIDGLVKNPMSLTLDDLKARPRQELTYTLECSG
ncbi:MAG: molybdopterin-dependent oxidoreductase, partial [Anaerolineae bacterium]|nr:molybdopterin-dependent oxidoreductase [Anaerolineae bacterium]